MKLFRKIKYRLRRFIVSLLFGVILCSTFIFGASAEVNSLLQTPNSSFLVRYYVPGNSDAYEFFPGDSFTTSAPTVEGSPISLNFNLLIPDSSDRKTNPFHVSSGVVGFDITFLSNQYLTSSTPDVKIYYYVDEVAYNFTIPSSDVNFSLTSTRQSGSGNNTVFLCELHLSFPANVLKSHNFHTVSFMIERTKSTHSAPWTLTSKTFSANVYTGNDVPSYAKPDTSAKNELDSVEGNLNDSIGSFGSGIGEVFDTDLIADIGLSMSFWSGIITYFFNSCGLLELIFTFSLAVGIFALLFGLATSLLSRSERHSGGKGNKKGGG